MTAQDKIVEAEYFLKRIEATRYDGIEVRHHLSAFLSSSRSIAEHLLEEYAQKYSLGISLENELNTKIFRIKSKGNNVAESFINYFDSKIEEIKKDPIGGVMWKKRNLNIHRFTAKPDKANIQLPPFNLSPITSGGIFDSNTSDEIINKQLQKEIQIKVLELKKMQPQNYEITYHFNELPMIELREGCKIFLDLMINLSTDIYNEFP